jgi:hypothetical protein
VSPDESRSAWSGPPCRDIGERSRGRDRRFLAGRDNGARNAAGVTLLAEDIDDVGEIGLGGLGDHVGRSRPVMAHPHVERTAEPKREAALGLIELHRGNADVHHDAVDRVDALRGADLGEMGEAILDQRQPPIGALDQIEPAGNRRPVAVDADDSGSSGVQDHPAIAAGAEGGVDIDSAVARAQHLDRLAAEHGDVTGGMRTHSPASGAFQRAEQELDANGSIAPQISALRRSLPAKRPLRGAIVVPRPSLQTLISERNLLGCHGFSGVKKGLGRPQFRFGSSSLSNGT